MGYKAGEAAHTAVPHQVVEGAQGVNAFHFVRETVQPLHDGLKGQAFLDEPRRHADQKDQGGPCCFGVEYCHLPFRLLFQEHLPRCAGAGVASGKLRGDGKGEGIAGFLKM